MKTKRISLLTLVLLAATITSNCILPKPENVDPGTIEGSTYSNRFFGMTLTIPQKWLAHSKDELSPMQQKGAELIAGENKGLKDKVDASEANSVQLITVSRYPLNYNGGFNASFQCQAEKLGLMSGISNSRDYIASFKKLMAEGQGQLKYTFGDDTYTESIGGKDFLAQDAHATLGRLSLEQKVCVSLIKGYALVFVITYTSTDDLDTLKDVLKSVSFSSKPRG